MFQSPPGNSDIFVLILHPQDLRTTAMKCRAADLKDESGFCYSISNAAIHADDPSARTTSDTLGLLDEFIMSIKLPWLLQFPTFGRILKSEGLEKWSRL